ncbi:brefeldin A-inhibited guanine nucleotide-exchange protein 4-like [Pyrus x bretschneideri]|uniref:brefeldin A-inhibited guanine nucleotide-exchange protein 4-like n=1 Tax=Pyrus x bretschneideri TaxID=225117 RepID=UPI00202E6851|nr:brefeldin A-inhibited guanine nucleotide-exchange protein 4-like [Pyrus x bretschneideri]
MISAPQLLHKHSLSDTTKIGPEVVLNLSIISATPEAKFSSLLTDNYGAYLKDKFGWVNWYLVGKFVKKNLYALHLFDDMSKRHNRENMSLSSNLEALDIVVLVCRYLPKDLVASFTEENGTLGHINAIKQFLYLSLLHIYAFTVMAISQLDYSIFTSLLSKLNQDLCNRVDVHLDAVFFPTCIVNDQIFQQPAWCHTLTDPCDNISYQRVVFNQRNKFNQRNYTIWLMKRPCILLSFKVIEENGKRKGFGFV